MSGWELMLKGGPVMIPIVICSMVALAIIIEKFSYFASIETNIFALKTKIFEAIRKNKIKDAIGVCDQDASPMARILKAGIMKYGMPRAQIKEAMEAASLYEIPQMERRLSALATVAHITPLLGLLGTVLGMAVSFYAIQAGSNALNPITPKDLAGGIWQSLITTVAGLVVAIPTYIAYNYCVARVDQLVLEMEKASAELVDLMTVSTETSSLPPEEDR